MRIMMTGWISLAFLVAIAYVSGNALPRGCNPVTSSSFGKTSRSTLDRFCEQLDEDAHPNFRWIGLNLKLPNCTLCCAGKSTAGPNIYYNVSTLPPGLCTALKKAQAARKKN
uniref:Tick salivary protein-SALP15 n=1 Tax=Rhipicephalus appendiculatus TaxID=34631 RepID=A0A131YS17_RHIAP